MNKETKIVLVWELSCSGVANTKIANDLDLHRETVGLWIKGIREQGINGFLETYLLAKKGPRVARQLNPIIKKLIYDIRDTERDCCGQKIRYFLEKDYGVAVSVTKIYEVLAEKYQLRTKWKKNVARGVIPIALAPRQVVQMDTVDFGDIFAFTAVDIYTKEADVILYSELTSLSGYDFLKTSMSRRFNNYSDLIQTDGGPEFKAEFHAHSHLFTNRHRIARAYKKNEQSYIESFNRSLRKECLGWSKYTQSQIPDLTIELNTYLNWYHYRRPHLSLNLTPPLTINKQLSDIYGE